MKKLLLCLTALLSFSAWAAQEFDSIDEEGNTIYCRIVESEEYPYACEVISSNDYNQYWEIYLPSTVYNWDDGQEYTVIGVGEYAFADCGSLETVTLPNTLTYLGECAFYVTGLTSITIPGSVTEWGANVFAECENLTEVILEEGLTSLGGYGTFEMCVSLQEVTFPNSLTSIGEYTFANCEGLTGVELPSNLVFIGDRAFAYCESLESINIPGTVTSFGKEIFEECESLSTVTLGEGLTFIADGLFSDCEAIESIDLPSTLISIGNSAFAYCYALQEITIPNKVITIGEKAFDMCDALQSVVIGSSVTSIGSQAFYYEKTGINFTILNPEPPTLGTNVFQSDNATVYVPAGTLTEYKNEWGTPSGVSTYKELDYAVLKITLADNSGVGYATYYNEDYDVTIPDGITAYWAENVEDGVVTLTEIASSIPAETAVVLKGALTDIAEASVTSATETSEYATNFLHGQSTTDFLLEEEDGDYLYYMLTTNMAGEYLGFYWGGTGGSAFVSKANKAWLAVPAGQSNALSIKFKDNETTGITSVETEVDATTVSGIYTLQGVRVSDMYQKGIYIVNGKKVLVK